LSVDAHQTSENDPVEDVVMPSERNQGSLHRKRPLLTISIIALVLSVGALAASIFRERLIPTVPSKALTVPIVRNSPSSIENVPSADGSPKSFTRFSDPLPVAPDSRLVEQSRFGIMPRVSEDGVKPREVYSRPLLWSQIAQQLPVRGTDTSRPGRNPRIGIVVTGAGLSYLTTVEALMTLPANVTFAFSPYASDVDDQVADARRDGHEIILEIPMESSNARLNDPGRMALMTDLDTNLNIERLSWIMSRFPGYFAAIPFMGEKFMSKPEKLNPILSDLSDRGLALVNASENTFVKDIAAKLNLPFAQSNLQIDSELDLDSIRTQLANLEQIARKEGVAIGTMRPVNLTIRQLELWINSLPEKGIDLVPVSAIVMNRKDS